MSGQNPEAQIQATVNYMFTGKCYISFLASGQEKNVSNTVYTHITGLLGVQAAAK